MSPPAGASLLRATLVRVLALVGLAGVAAAEAGPTPVANETAKAREQLQQRMAAAREALTRHEAEARSEGGSLLAQWNNWNNWPNWRNWGNSR